MQLFSFSMVNRGNIPSLYCRIFFLLLFFLLNSSSLAFSTVKVEVVVLGLEERVSLYENVLARLKIYLQKDNDQLLLSDIKRLYRVAEDDIKSALAPFGYYNPAITSSLDDKNDVWRAVYVVVPGPPVLVDSIDLKMEGTGRNNDLLVDALAGFSLKSGDILDQTLYEQEKKKLIHLAFGEGFLDAFFAERALWIDREKNSSEVRLVLQTGKQYYFGDTTCAQPILKQELLDRYLPYSSGQPYRPAKLFELQSILYKTDYFSRVVVTGQVGKAVNFTIPVEVELTAPEHLNKYTLGVGYATDTGVKGKVNWSNRLFNTKGHKINASFQLSELENAVSLGYTVPRKDPRYDSISHVLSYQDKRWDDTTTQLFSAGVVRVYKGPRYNYSTGFVIRDEIYDVGDTSGKSILLMPSLNFGLILADEIQKTQNGLKTTVGVVGGLEGLVSDVSFVQFTLGGKMIVSPLDDLRLICRGNLGVTLVDSIDELPPSLRFYTGGDTTIRGYRYKSIGTEDSSGTVIGGRYLVIGSIEAEWNVAGPWSVASFWDGGNATDDLSLDFYQGVGVGVRYRLPFGQIRLDMASAISEDGNPLRVHLTVGGDL